MTDLTEVVKAAGEAGAATDLAKDSRVALRMSCGGLSNVEEDNLRFAIGVSRGIKMRGRAYDIGAWKPEIAAYLAVLEPLGLSGLSELSKALEKD